MITTPCIESPGPLSAAGYARVPFGDIRIDALGRKRGRKMVLLHRWVVEQIEGYPLADGEIVMHECDNPPCFRYDHLRRGTQAENVADAEMKGRGRRAHGRGHPGAKLTEDAVKLIRARATEGFATRQIATEFGVSRTLIRKVIARTSWPHVP